MDDTFAFATDLIQRAPVPIAKHVFIIAEIGINHNGSVEIAKRLIDMARASGCDAVKFQKRTIDLVYTKEFLDSPRESPWGTTQRAQKEALEFEREEYDEIDRYCKYKGIHWFASAWDVPSQLFLRQYNLKYNKIASAMLAHRELLERTAEERKVTFISTGMSSYEQIDAAVELFRRYRCPFVLMHCVSEYPSPEAALNLRCILELHRRYQCPVGYSGHEVTMIPSVFAAMMGAVAVERHITLDRAMYGSDQAASLEKRGLELMVSYIRTVAEVVGDGVKRITPGELKAADKLRYYLGPFFSVTAPAVVPDGRPVRRRVVLILQARNASTRLPGKTMMDLAGAPMLGRILERVKRCQCVDKIVVATTQRSEDDPIGELARSYGVAVFRGSEHDLVDRYYQAAKAHNADVIVRLPADNATPEPTEIDRIITYHLTGQAEFSSNLAQVYENGYPDGIGAEVFDFKILEEVWKTSEDPRLREHVHLNFFDYSSQRATNPKYRVGTVECLPEFRRPDLVLDVNTAEQYEFMSQLYCSLYPQKPQFHITDIIRWYDEVYHQAASRSATAR